MNAYDINSNSHILGCLIEKALIDTVRWAYDQCNSQKPQEPDYVAALSIKFTEELFHILTVVFPNYDFSVSSVYCHQKPIVDIGLGKKPELGDILFVYADRRTHERRLNSLLLQAKISANPYFRIHESEKHQLELYKSWPEFTYCRAGHLNGKKRSILPKTINDGAQYLLIDNNPLTNGVYFEPDMIPMACAVPDDTLYANKSLSGELVDFLKFKSGRTFDSNPRSTEDDWSKMIWDLLKIAAGTYSKRKNARLSSFPRSVEYDYSFKTKAMRGGTLLDEALDGYIGRAETLNENDQEDIGVSVVLIESQLKREQEERRLY